MSILRCFAVSVSLAAAVSAVETRTEVVRPDNPAEAVRPNNPAVPDVYAVQGNFARVVVLRFKYDADLLAGLQRMVKELHIRNAVILAGIGSVRSYSLFTVKNDNLPARTLRFTDPEGSADIIGMSGYVIEGKLHPHITLATTDRAFGGHLMPGTKVFAFAAVTIGVFADGIDLRHLDEGDYR